MRLEKPALHESGYRVADELDVGRALPAPSKRVQDAVLELARTPYFLPRWWAAARAAGAALGVESVDELLGAMIHPVPPPDDLDAVEWVFRVQLAGSLLLGHVDQGWAGSRRREVLFSLVDGVMDWTTDTAIVALRELALDEPAAVAEVEARFWQLFQEIPTPGHYWFGEVLASSYLRLPGGARDRREACEKWLAALDEGAGGGDK